VVAVEIAARPPELADRVNGDGIRVGPASDVDGLRPCRLARSRGEGLALREMLLHRGAATEPRIALEQRARRLVLPLADHRGESSTIGLPSTEESMWQMTYGLISTSFPRN